MLIQQGSTHKRLFFLGSSGLTPSIQISRDGGAFADPSAGPSNATELSGGWYYFALSTVDTGTLGELAYLLGAGTMDASFVDQVVAVNLADGVRLGLTALPNASAGGNGGLPVNDSNSRVPAAVEFLEPAVAQQVADALLDRSGAVESSLTPRQALRLIAAALAGKVSISGNTVTFRNAVDDSKDRITATTDSNGQRTAISVDAS